MSSLYEIYEKRLLEDIRIHDRLNPVIWNSDNTLKPEVKDKLLQIVDYFLEYMEVPIHLLDVRIVGSNADYTYTESSDIDLHLVTEFEDIGSPKGVVSALLNCEKSQFNKTYDISIKGIQVEVYIEDINTGAISNGIYSLSRDEWIKFPEPRIGIQTNINITTEVSQLKDEIENLISKGCLSDLNTLLDSLYIMRKNGISIDGEFSKGNLIFKELRQLGYLTRIKETIATLQSKELSLESLHR